jgi:site-specific DNA-methyltransferase (adenine-specific)
MKPYYADELVTLYHGDCREILPELDPASVDLVMTDPPFSVPVTYQDVTGTHIRSWGDLIVMEPFFREVFTAVKRVVRKGGQVYVCCDGDTYPVFYKASYSLWPQSHMLVWYKPSGRRGRGWLHSHEIVLHLRTEETRYAEGFRQDVIGIMPVRTLNRQHPAEKPGDLWTFLAEGMPKPIYTVLDPFLGGGGLLDWARMRGHRAIGIEIEERYCELTARRLAQGTLGEIAPVPELVRLPEPGQFDLFGGEVA